MKQVISPADAKVENWWMVNFTVHTPGKNKNNMLNAVALLLFILFHIIYKYGINIF